MDLWFFTGVGYPLPSLRCVNRTPTLSLSLNPVNPSLLHFFRTRRSNPVRKWFLQFSVYESVTVQFHLLLHIPSWRPPMPDSKDSVACCLPTCPLFSLGDSSSIFPPGAPHRANSIPPLPAKILLTSTFLPCQLRGVTSHDPQLLTGHFQP